MVLSNTSIQVIRTIDKKTIGLIAAGTPNSQAAAYIGMAHPFNLCSPLESTYGTSHSETVTGIPASPNPGTVSPTSG